MFLRSLEDKESLIFKKLKYENFKGRVRIIALENNEIAKRGYARYCFKPYEIIYERVIE